MLFLLSVGLGVDDSSFASIIDEDVSIGTRIYSFSSLFAPLISTASIFIDILDLLLKLSLSFSAGILNFILSL